ncbi:MAG TPA: ABC transporter permease subunit [Xanthobacteraceae bacterium]|nr:ABC transporter permease subunit [Xanthobacteraceae bacterium]
MRARRAYDLALTIALAVSVLLFLVPQYFFVRQSFHESLGMGQIGDTLTLANYAHLFADSFYLAAFVRTAALSAAATLAGLLLAFPTAYALARSGSRLLRALIVLLLISSFVSIVVKVLGLTLLLGSGGPVVALIRLASGGWWSPSILHSDTAVAIGFVQYTLPLLVMLLFGVIQNIPRSLEEAAQVAGASDARMTVRVLLPLAFPGLVTAALISFNMNMGAFTSAVLLGGGNVLTLPVLIQRKIILEVDYPAAAALSVVLTLAVIAINLLVLAIRPRALRVMSEAA